MAKSEQTAETTAEAYDPEDVMNEVLSDLPDEVELSGAWLLQFRGGKVQSGVSDNGPWQMLSLFFAPIEPAGDQEISPDELDDLPSLRHRVFYTRKSDKRAFLKLAAKFGVETEGMTLSQIIEELKGEEIIATVKLGTDNRDEPEYKLTGFKAVPDSV